MDKTIKETAQLHFKKMVLSYAEMCGSDKKSIDLFQVSRSTYYHWKKKYKRGGYKELLRQTPDRSKDPRCIAQEAIDLVLKLRKEQKIGSKRIVWYLERYHGITISESSVTRILTKYGMARLKPGTPRRSLADVLMHYWLVRIYNPTTLASPPHLTASLLILLNKSRILSYRYAPLLRLLTIA